MSKQIDLRFGALPWEPADNAELIEVYDRHDRPITGLLRQHDQAYVFDCLEGHAWDVNIWIYAPVDDELVERLAEAEGADFRKALDHALTRCDITAALAVGDRLEMTVIVPRKDLTRDLYVGVMHAVVTKVESGPQTVLPLKNLQMAM
ncbi:hypothetical protein [Nonomuraea typhae]|uniref:hypothetical protein n=1 Tax=Nonomuraea typhae TaxID=2603600 RepID=UPI0012FC47ED|nr:hypothetical protein [Nonomuraea typhae]